jgi:hypothetical protein
MAAEPADPLDSLYEALPAEFVKARNALVKSLKAAGQREQSEAAAKLSRPTASVWVTNQIARHAPDLVERLAEATARLQGGAPRDRERYAAAINTHRELLNEVRAKVDETLQRAGLRVAPPVIAAAVQNFRAGLMDEAAREALQQGRLQDDVPLDAGGGLFGAGILAPVADDEPEPARVHHPPAKPAHDHQARADEKARERERREQERALAKARADAERRVHTVRKTADAATAAREKQEDAVASARREVERAERALAAAQAAESEAQAALAAAQAELEKLPRHPA